MSNRIVGAEYFQPLQAYHYKNSKGMCRFISTNESYLCESLKPFAKFNKHFLDSRFRGNDIE